MIDSQERRKKNVLVLYFRSFTWVIQFRVQKVGFWELCVQFSALENEKEHFNDKQLMHSSSGNPGNATQQCKGLNVGLLLLILWEASDRPNTRILEQLFYCYSNVFIKICSCCKTYKIMASKVCVFAVISNFLMLFSQFQ